VAWLLTNSLLRERFNRSSVETADLLDISPSDRDAFLVLDRHQLEAQAEAEAAACAEGAAQRRREVGMTMPDQPPLRPSARSHSQTSYYCLLTTTMAVRSASGLLLAELDAALGHLSTSAAPVDVDVEIRLTHSGWELHEGGCRLTESRRRAGIVPAIKQLLRERAVDRYPSWVSVHAGVVAFGDECVLLPAAAGSGKTTLTAALIAGGCTYFSDEIAVLEERALRVVPVPLSLTVKDGSVIPLHPLYPGLGTVTAHVREDYIRVRYLQPPIASLPDATASGNVRWIVFPKYSPGLETNLRPVDRPTALKRLLGESYLSPGALERARVESLVRWMRTIDCYELPFASLSLAAELVRGLAAHRERPEK